MGARKRDRSQAESPKFIDKQTAHGVHMIISIVIKKSLTLRHESSFCVSLTCFVLICYLVFKLFERSSQQNGQILKNFCSQFSCVNVQSVDEIIELSLLQWKPLSELHYSHFRYPDFSELFK